MIHICGHVLVSAYVDDIVYISGNYMHTPFPTTHALRIVQARKTYDYL
jgi:hypothetical protein